MITAFLLGVFVTIVLAIVVFVVMVNAGAITVEDDSLSMTIEIWKVRP